MIDRNRITATAFGLLALGAAVAYPATAAADPPPEPLPLPAEPAPPPELGPVIPMIGAPLGPAGFNILAQNGIPAADQPGTLGAPNVVGLDRDSVLGQNLVPAAPNGGTGIVPNLNVFNNAYGLPQYVVPSAPGGEQFDVAPGQENTDVTKREWFGRFIDMQRDGRTYGGLGQAPLEQLGQPLPGTAPPPGTNIPPGLVQFLPEPVDPNAPPPPPPAP